MESGLCAKLEKILSDEHMTTFIRHRILISGGDELHNLQKDDIQSVIDLGKYICENDSCSEMMQKCDNCKQCRGRCCRNYGCGIYPWDIKANMNITEDDIWKAIETGNVAIDDYIPFDGENVLFLRMRHVHSPIFDESYGGVCVMFDPKKGCKLSFDKRPSGGKFLVVNDKDCEEIFTKREIAICWLPYQDILRSVITRLDEYPIYNIIDDFLPYIG